MAKKSKGGYRPIKNSHLIDKGNKLPVVKDEAGNRKWVASVEKGRKETVAKTTSPVATVEVKKVAPAKATVQPSPQVAVKSTAPVKAVAQPSPNVEVRTAAPAQKPTPPAKNLALKSTTSLTPPAAAKQAQPQVTPEKRAASLLKEVKAAKATKAPPVKSPPARGK